MADSQIGQLAISGDSPAGFTLDRTARTVSWTPSDGQNGTYTVRVQGSAGGGSLVSETVFSLRVADNVPPRTVFYLPSEQAITKGDAWADEGVVCEDDVDTPRHILAASAPDTDVAGAHTLTYECTDSFGLEAEPATRILNVVSPDTAPRP